MLSRLLKDYFYSDFVIDKTFNFSATHQCRKFNQLAMMCSFYTSHVCFTIVIPFLLHLSFVFKNNTNRQFKLGFALQQNLFSLHLPGLSKLFLVIPYDSRLFSIR